MPLRKHARKALDRFLRRRLELNRGNWRLAARQVPLASGFLKHLAHPLWGRPLRKMAGFEGRNRYTQSYVVPINRRIDYRSRSLVVPIEKIRRAVETASFRAVMNRCICRDGYACQHYPRNMGCLQLGEGSRNMVRRGIAREATAEEALAHLEQAAEAGLVAIAAWVEMEALILGVPEEDHERYLEICMCCPCCCMGMRNFRHIFHDRHMRGRFNTTGWRAQGTEGCTGCRKCAEHCPMDAIRVTGKSITVYDTCIGCGLCAGRCTAGAIVMEETTPMKERIQDHFWGLDLRLEG